MQVVRNANIYAELCLWGLTWPIPELRTDTDFIRESCILQTSAFRWIYLARMKCNVGGVDRGILSEISRLTVARALPVHISRNRTTIALHKECFLDRLIPNISSRTPAHVQGHVLT